MFGNLLKSLSWSRYLVILNVKIISGLQLGQSCTRSFFLWNYFVDLAHVFWSTKQTAAAQITEEVNTGFSRKMCIGLCWVSVGLAVD